MNQPTKFLKADFYLQTILGFVIIIQSSLVDSAWYLMPVGLWQVISALVLLVFYPNKMRVYYFFLVFIWMLLAGYLSYYGTSDQKNLTSIAYAAPPILAIFYYILTATNYRAAQKAASSTE
jgi:hypothetical protein